MRTTLTIEDGLLEEAKSRAKKQKTTLGAVVNEALRHGLLRSSAASTPPTPLSLPTFRGDGVQPGVDLNDGASLRDWMERP